MGGAAGLTGGVAAGRGRAGRIAGGGSRAGRLADQGRAAVEIGLGQESLGGDLHESRVAEIDVPVGVGEAHGLGHLEPGLGIARPALVYIRTLEQPQHLQQARPA